jgi:predicted phage terminase large subunit-like protein
LQQAPGPAILEQFGRLSPDRQERLLRELERRSEEGADARSRFLPFVRKLWPAFREGRHHPALANAFERIAAGTLRRLMINMPPRHGKSEFCSVYLPPWYMGKFPDKKIICATHTEKLSLSFGRRVRNLVRDPDYAEIFPECRIAKDSKASGKWSTTLGGEYFAIGVGGALAGRGANLMLIDDPHSEQDVITGGEGHFEKVYEWYQTGPRQRLQPGAAVIVNATRWGKRDLCGRLLQDARTDRLSDQWEVLSLPAILPSGEALFPEFWPLQELELLRRSLTTQRWNAQYQQNPVSEEAAVVKSAWWKPWTGRPPKLVFTVQSWDTSFGEYAKGDPSACTLWGVFHPNREPGQPRSAPSFGIVLIDAFEARLTFPDLKAKALELYRQQKPDSLAIEARAAGSPLLQELARMSLPIARYAPTAGNDKLTRLNAVSDLFRSGMVWYLDSCPLAPRVIQQFAEYPDGDHDDLMDSGVQALTRIREGGWVKLESDDGADEDEDGRWMPPQPREAYY